MPTNAEIQALIQKEVRQQKSHLVRNGLADILDYMIDNMGAGPGGTPGIDDVLAENQALTAARTLHLGGFPYYFEQGDKYFLIADPTPGGENTSIAAYNLTGDGNYGVFIATAANNGAGAQMYGTFNDGAFGFNISGDCNAGGSTLSYTADTHTFNAGGQENGKVSLAESLIRAFDPTDDDNFSNFSATAAPTGATAIVNAVFNDGVKQSQIAVAADATSSSITHTADTHTFNGVNVNMPLTDGLATAGLTLQSQTGSDVLFNIRAKETGIDEVKIVGNGIANTITHTADTHTMNVGYDGLTVQSGSVGIRGLDPTNDNNVGEFSGVATATEAGAIITADFNDGVKRARISAFADATTSTITHTADQHIFVGAVMLPTSDPGVSGAIWNNAGTPAISV